MATLKSRSIVEQNHSEIKYLKKEEWLHLLESVDNHRDKLIVKLLYSTGMRVGELAKLKVENIDFHERFIHIPAENTKTNTARTVIVQKDVLSDVSAYLKIARIKHGRLLSLTVRRYTAVNQEIRSERQFRGFSAHFKAYSHSPRPFRPHPNHRSPKTSWP